MTYILFADDDKFMRHMVQDLLASGGYEVGLAEDGTSTLTEVKSRQPDLLILDLEMPGPSGFEVCRTLKENPFTAGIPILMLTGRSAIESKVEGFEAGADDYLSKPFDSRELRARVEALLRLVRREGDRNPTSGLPGTRAIDEHIAGRIASQSPFVICYADIDNFKAFADNFGFAIANEVISGTGRALRHVLERLGVGHDFVGHVGGDDFLIVTDESRAVTIARECAEEFMHVLEAAIGADVVSEGVFHGRDRDGEMRVLPLSRLSVAILTVDPKKWISVTHLGARVAESKRNAKRKGPGTILLDVG